DATLNFMTAPVAGMQLITATATLLATGDTSEFSAALPTPLNLIGTDGDDAYYVTLDSTGTIVQVYAGNSAAAAPVYSFPAGLLSSVVADLGSGNDSLTLDFSHGSPLPASGILYDGGSTTGTESNVLRVIGTPNADVVTLADGQLLVNGA